MPQITNYPVLAAPAPNDILICVDVSDTSMSPEGTTKQVTVNHISSIVGSAAVYTEAAPGGQIIVVVNTSAAPSDASIHLEGKAAGDLTIGGRVTGDAHNRWVIDTNGDYSLGTGAANPDTSLHRGATGGLVVSDPDGNTYDTQRLTLRTTGMQTISATSAAVITGLSCPVIPRTYRLRCSLAYQGNQNAGVPTFGIHSPAISLSLMCGYFMASNLGATQPIAFVNNSTGAISGAPTLTSGGFVQLVFDMTVTFSAAGTLSLQASTSSGSDTFTIQGNSILEVFPVI